MVARVGGSVAECGWEWKVKVCRLQVEQRRSRVQVERGEEGGRSADGVPTRAAREQLEGVG